ncbi:uncharacterized protein A4U43_C07F10300 [Asparagus officinalis]|uniref:Uncharacterized protein n=1 Tax=Asparagus officinalis TaxID=4686 RepID=A0A5P1EAT7_ASPOF|nr:uncharacterized protein A4U43_C07F10300 [Asparagus officinalis]
MKYSSVWAQVNHILDEDDVQVLQKLGVYIVDHKIVKKVAQAELLSSLHFAIGRLVSFKRQQPADAFVFARIAEVLWMIRNRSHERFHPLSNCWEVEAILMLLDSSVVQIAFL